MTEEMTPAEQIEEHQVFFAFGRDKMNSEGEASLDFIIEKMKANPAIKLQINAHNNEMEDEVAMENDYYADMDGKRLGAVMKYLLAGGIEEGRLMAIDETEPTHFDSYKNGTTPECKQWEMVAKRTKHRLQEQAVFIADLALAKLDKFNCT